MKLLLDTHIFLWFVSGDPKLSSEARALVENLENERFLSVASIWEMVIKNQLGKLSFDEPIEQFVPAQLERNQIEVLTITQEHVYQVGQLPLHHRDPFDRILIAQSIIEAMTLLSADNAFDDYVELNRVR